MSNEDTSLYSDAKRYDLVEAAYATGKFLDFYQRQVARYGEPVLELACGSGRLTIPLAEAGINITGVDLSEDMLDLARLKASKRGVTPQLVHADVRAFDLGRQFKFIFIPAQSLTHLQKRYEIEDCFACVRQHLAVDGRLLVELFNPSMKLLARAPETRYDIGEYDDSDLGGKVKVTEEVHYDSAEQTSYVRWFFRSEGSDEERVLCFSMRQFFPCEIDELLWYNGLKIEHKYGDYDENEFCDSSPQQLIVCSIS